jgi:G:T-mismatch repair DNA endonuclease (very short patch repair protein)
VGRFQVDGFVPKERLLLEFHGDFWHGNPKFFDANDFNPVNKKKYGDLYNQTLERMNVLVQSGYRVIYIWETDFREWCKSGMYADMPIHEHFCPKEQ